ncbi:MAG: hypothetical protein M1823_002920 [Watsoniomyces obsoletus]|nr:MAG: hypothetical protein M1823_002920 [Watsoniomyces obsoletus]
MATLNPNLTSPTNNANQTDHPMPSTTTSSSSSDPDQGHSPTSADEDDEDDDEGYEDTNEMFPGDEESGPASNISMMSNSSGGVAFQTDNDHGDPSTPQAQHMSVIASDELSPPNSQDSQGGGGAGGVALGGGGMGWTSAPQFPTIEDTIQSQPQSHQYAPHSQGKMVGGMFHDGRVASQNVSGKQKSQGMMKSSSSTSKRGNGNRNGAAAAAIPAGLNKAPKGEGNNDQDQPRWSVALSNWRSRKNREEHHRAMERLLDQGFWGGKLCLFFSFGICFFVFGEYLYRLRLEARSKKGFVFAFIENG